MAGRVTVHGTEEDPVELRERATRMTLETLADDPARSMGAIKRIAEGLGLPRGPSCVGASGRGAPATPPGTITTDAGRIKELEKEVREPCRPTRSWRAPWLFSRRGSTARPVALQLREIQEGRVRGPQDARRAEPPLGRQASWQETLPAARWSASCARWGRRAKAPHTTRPAPREQSAADLADRHFSALKPNELWVADITYVRTISEWAHVAFVIDPNTRRIVSWQISTSLYSALALDGLNVGIWQRRRDGADLAGLVHHSDRGVHYRFIRYRQSLADCLEVASVGQGDSYDNALAGALNFLSHAEFIRNKASWTSIDDIELATAEWVHWYNPVRPHSAIGMHALIEHEHAHHPRTGAEVEDPDVADCPYPRPPQPDNTASTKRGSRAALLRPHESGCTSE